MLHMSITRYYLYTKQNVSSYFYEVDIIFYRFSNEKETCNDSTHTYALYSIFNIFKYNWKKKYYDISSFVCLPAQDLNFVNIIE